MGSSKSWRICLALLICLAAPGMAQFPGMPGMGGFGPAPGGFDMGGLLGQLGGLMGGMGDAGGMGMMGAAPTPVASKYISPLVPLCWAVGRSQYPGIACLYATREQKAQLEALIQQVAPQIEGRFWIKFADVTIDTDPPSFIREILSPKYRNPKGGGGGAVAASAGTEMGMGGMESGMGGGMGAPAAGAAPTDKQAQVEARKKCPAIIIFGKDMFSQGAGAAAAPTAAVSPTAGMGGIDMGMGASGGGMAAPTAAAGASKWASMDRNFMIHWSFVGSKEMPTPEVLRFVLDEIGDRDTGIDRWTRALKFSRKNTDTTIQLAKAYVRALQHGKQFLPTLGLSSDPTRSRMVQQNQYMADYLLARAETLAGGEARASEIRAEQAKLTGHFRYEGPSTLTPILSKHFPGVVGYFRTPQERLQLENILDMPAVQQALDAGHYWAKLVNVVPGDTKADSGLIGMLKDAKLDVEIHQYPALVVCGQDVFREGDPVEMAKAGGAAAATGEGAGMMGGDMGMSGMGGMGMESGVAAGGAATGGSTSTDDGKLTGWILGGNAAGAAGAASASMSAGMGAAGESPEGMAMGGEMMMGGGGAAAATAMGTIGFSDYDYRQPNRMAYLMQYSFFEGVGGPRPLPGAVQLGAVLNQARTADDLCRQLKADKGHDDVDLLLGVGESMVRLNQSYLADYFLARAERCIRDEEKKIKDAEQRLADDPWATDADRTSWQNRYGARRQQFVNARTRLRALRTELLVAISRDESSLQIPVLLNSFPGIVVFYQGDASFDPDAAVPSGSGPVRSRASDYIHSLLAQPHIADYIRDKYWVKYIRVKYNADDPGVGIDTQPEFLTALPALLLMGPDAFSDPQVVGGKAAGPGGGQAAAGMEQGMGMEPGMGMGMETGGAAMTSSATGDPTEWLPAAGAAAATVTQAGGETMGMEGMGMGTPTAAPAAGGKVEPVGIIAGNSPSEGGFAQWVDYGHENQLGRRNGFVMVHQAYVGRRELPAQWSGPQKAEDFDPFRRVLERVAAVDELSRQVFAENRDAGEKNPDGQVVMDLAYEYLGLPGNYMAEYMLSRAQYLADNQWTPDPERVTAAVKEALAEQAKGADYTGSDRLMQIRNYLMENPDGDRSAGAWLNSPAPGAWLAALTALNRMGDLPTFFAPQYASGNLVEQSGSEPMVTTAHLAGAISVTTGRTELSGLARLPACYQQPPEKLTNEQLRDVRTALLQAVRGGLSGADAKVAWSRLLQAELELRTRTKASGVDASWREIMSAWQSSPSAQAYQDVVKDALTRALGDELRAMRAINDVDLRLHGRGGPNLDNPAYTGTTLQPPDTVGSPLSELGVLRDYLKKRPHDRGAQQARYLLGVLLEAGPTAGDNPRFTEAAREQFDALKPAARPPHWWRWGNGRWSQFQAF
jgi:hypothetical protein